MTTQIQTATQRPQSLSERFAAKLSVTPAVMLATLKATCFKQPTKWNPDTRRHEDGPEVTNEQMVALLIVADKYGLDPFTKQIYAFADKGGIVPVVGVDGWQHLMNSHPQMDGIEYEYGPTVTVSPSRGKRDFKSGQMVYAEFGPITGPEWIECIITRKDRSKPIRIREYLVECARDTDPWRVNTSRMLRHRSTAQCIRVAFGFSGVHEEDEALTMIDATATAAALPATAGGVSKLAALGAKSEAATAVHPAKVPEAGELVARVFDQAAQMFDAGLPSAEVIAHFERSGVVSESDAGAWVDARYGDKE